MANIEKQKEVLRERIDEILRTEEAFKSDQGMPMAQIDISQALVQCAFARLVGMGGINDVCHAAKVLHRMVDATGTSTNSEYSQAKLQSYVEMSKASGR